MSDERLVKQEDDPLHDRGHALWRRIADALARAIIAGERQPGDQLPTEHRLAAEYGVNRHTVRRALAALVDQGLVRVEQGRGSFVQESVIDYRVRKRTRFSENIAAQQREPSGRLLRAAELKAEDAVARALELRKGSLVTLMETLGEADGRPISLASHYFPRSRFPDLETAYHETGSISRALALRGMPDYTRKLTRVTARMPRAEDARLLQQPPNRPILLAESINVDADGRPVEYAVTRFASERVQIIFEPEH